MPRLIDADALEKECVNECEFCKTEGSEVCLNKGDYYICELCWEDSHKQCSYYERAAYCRRCGRKLEEAP